LQGVSVELPGTAYLYNLSLLSVTFATVSALVMLVRQTLGGRLSKFDIFLLRGFISFSLFVAFAAILPPLAALSDAATQVLWPLTSAAAAILLAVNLYTVIVRRRKATGEPAPTGVTIRYIVHGIVIALLVINAIVPAVQGIALYAAALTLCLGNMMWAFVRRISSLLGEKPSKDWDPRSS
jgi:hypothetical protein